MNKPNIVLLNEETANGIIQTTFPAISAVFIEGKDSNLRFSESENDNHSPQSLILSHFLLDMHRFRSKEKAA